MNLKKFNQIWPIIGGGFAILIIVLILIFWNDSSLIQKLALLYWSNLAVLMLHEFEEYVLPGGFKHFINHNTIFAIEELPEAEPINDIVIVVINLGIWFVFILAALITSAAPWLGFGMIIFNIVNIIGHLIIFQKVKKGYNPGTITALLMIPFLILSFIFVINNDFLNLGGYLIAGIIGFASGASLPIFGSIIKKKAIKNNL
jgi:hypothetical protein